MAYAIGEITYHNGDEVTITSEPYELYGGLWQDGTLANGKTATVATPEYRAAKTAANQKVWKDQQAAFSSLRGKN